MEKLIANIKRSGNRLTKPRLDVLKALQKSEIPLSAQEIHTKLKGVDLASVYRSLKLFKELGAVQAEAIGGGEKYCLAVHPHHHIICEKCGHMESVECTHKFAHKNFSAIKHHLTLTGICRHCR